MEGFLSDMDFKKNLRLVFEKFVEEGVRFEDIKPEDAGKMMYRFCTGLFESIGLKIDLFDRIFLYTDKEERKTLERRLTSMEVMFLLLPTYEIDKGFYSKVDRLFEICKQKDPDRLEEIFLKPRVEVIHKVLSNFQIHWMYMKRELVEEDMLDKNFGIIRYLFNSMYRELLLVFQEMLEIAFDYAPAEDLDTILENMRNAPVDLSGFVNENVSLIGKAERYESMGSEIGDAVVVYSSNDTTILEVKDFDEARLWLRGLLRNAFQSLRKKYFEWNGIDPDPQCRLMHMLQIFLSG